jgi:predicted enzyme related to lactoylglutathione lyase
MAASRVADQEEEIMDHTIVHFEIPADNPERATQFYRELFGWDIQKFESEGDGHRGESHEKAA